jgi:hypothetical protein
MWLPELFCAPTIAYQVDDKCGLVLISPLRTQKLNLSQAYLLYWYKLKQLKG